MNGFRTRRELLVATAGASIALAGCLEAGDDDPGEADVGDGNDENGVNGSADENGVNGSADENGEADATWLTTELEDVRTGETFTIGGFDDPVLLHTFAIWCSTCQQQHGEFADLMAEGDVEFVPVELNVDPNEDADAVADHAEQYGYTWPFAVSPPELTSVLVDEFGTEMTSPPASPVVLVCPDGETQILDDHTVISAEDLEGAIEDRC